MSYFDGVRGETVGSLSLLASQGELDKVRDLLANDGGRERWRAADNKGWAMLRALVQLHRIQFHPNPCGLIQDGQHCTMPPLEAMQSV